MNRLTQLLLTDLRCLIQDLGKDGGLTSPSIYDTAQVLRLAPPEQGVAPALDWLSAQQEADGGWGDPAVAHARDVSTLAAILALQTYGTQPQQRESIAAGLAFLKRQARQWEPPLSNDLPVAAELLMPCLLEDARALGLDLPEAPYAALMRLGNHRRALLAERAVGRSTPPAHSWEAFCSDPDAAQPDHLAGVGHSSAATASWLRATEGRADLELARADAREYLAQASAATGVGIPGVVPGVWPINRFEQAFGLYFLLIADLLDHPDLRDVVDPQIADMARSMRKNGLGFSDFFVPDGDDTAAALAVLQVAGYPVSLAPLNAFSTNDHFCAFHGEIQPSLSVTAHAVHTLSLFGVEHGRFLNYILERQQPDGLWYGDKWNSSWLYTTSQAVIVLRGTGHIDAMRRVLDALLCHQRQDGGWGVRISNREETAYGILACRALLREGLLDRTAWKALERAEQWMMRSYRPFDPSTYAYWLDKDAYRPQRLVDLIELVATIPYHTIYDGARLDDRRLADDSHTYTMSRGFSRRAG